MPVISRKKITARKRHYCEMCLQDDSVIRRGEKHWRLYGYATEGDPPYVIRRHVECEEPGPEGKEAGE